MMKRKHEAGQALVLAAVAVVFVLIPIMGLGIDVGYYRSQEVQLQTAADAAAIGYAPTVSDCVGDVLAAFAFVAVYIA